MERPELRLVTAADDGLIEQIYGSTRADLEQLPLEPMQKSQLIGAQSQMQLADYARSYPNAEHSIVQVGSEPAGRIIVDRTDEQIYLVDVALLPEFRGRGIGSALIHDLVHEARTRDVPIQLSVLRSNTGAMALYERLGFARDTTAPNDMYYSMMWRASVV